MKLSVAPIFSEHMVIRQNVPVPIWGRCANGDSVTVSIGNQEKTILSNNGEWSLTLDPLKPSDKIKLIISSKKTNEEIILNDVAVGEVVFAGGQSNMEFLMKYDFDFEEVKKSKKEHNLRCFTCPQSPFVGFEEKEPCPDWNYWRTFEEDEDKGLFSAVGAYMGLYLMKELNVPVGIISCNWGGTPAPAWINIEDIKENPKLQPVLDWHKEACEKINWDSYIKTAYEPNPVPTAEFKAFTDKFMMGEDMSEFFKSGPPPMNPDIYNAYLPGPLSCVRPGGLYENMLKKVAPFPVSLFIWWQGEDDDARDFVDYYDESMKTLIKSWRKLWNEEIPFFQVELAPFRGKGPTAAKHYDILRHKQYLATSSLPKAYDICILDAGEEYNIHPRHKKIVGNRLAKMALKYVYGKDIKADCPIFKDAIREDNKITLSFENTYGEIYFTSELRKYFFVYRDGEKIDYKITCALDKIILEGEFGSSKIKIEYAESNYAYASIFNIIGNPLFGFHTEV